VGFPVIASSSSEAKEIAASVEPDSFETPDYEQEQEEYSDEHNMIPQHIVGGYLAAVAAAQVAHQSSLTQQFIAEVTFVARMAGITRPVAQAVVSAVRGIWIAGGDPSITDSFEFALNPEFIFDRH